MVRCLSLKEASVSHPIFPQSMPYIYKWNGWDLPKWVKSEDVCSDESEADLVRVPTVDIQRKPPHTNGEC